MAEEQKQQKQHSQREQPVKERQQEFAQKTSEKESADFKYIVRIANTDLDGKKQMIMALQKIKGISFMLANAFCAAANVDKIKRAGDLSDDEIQKLDALIKEKKPNGIPAWLFNRRKDFETGEDMHLIGGDLTFSKESDIRLMKKIKCYKGIRHMQGATVRGQRTRSNFRKNKGKVTSVKRSVLAKAAAAAKSKDKEKKE